MEKQTFEDELFERIVSETNNRISENEIYQTALYRMEIDIHRNTRRYHLLKVLRRRKWWSFFSKLHFS